MRDQVPSGWRNVLEGAPPDGTEQTLVLQRLYLSLSSARTPMGRLGPVHWLPLG